MSGSDEGINGSGGLVSGSGDLLLGRVTDYELPYSPTILQALPRSMARAALGLTGESLPFSGVDIWNAYELSWLEPSGKPVVAWGEVRVPADSPHLVESKSFKLYLNSLNQQRFADAAAVAELIAADLAACVGSAVDVRVTAGPDWPGQLSAPAGRCLDDLPLVVEHYHPEPGLLTSMGAPVQERLYSHLLRSRCPVTGQPDWGTVLIDYCGPAINHTGLLAYIVSYRLHQDFHESCVERIFMDLLARCRPQRLTVAARYLRRGGLDINPVRSSETDVMPLNTRLFRQ